jgi:hypothetical protein
VGAALIVGSVFVVVRQEGKPEPAPAPDAEPADLRTA